MTSEWATTSTTHPRDQARHKGIAAALDLGCCGWTCAEPSHRAPHRSGLRRRTLRQVLDLDLDRGLYVCQRRHDVIENLPGSRCPEYLEHPQVSSRTRFLQASRRDHRRDQWSGTSSCCGSPLASVSSAPRRRRTPGSRRRAARHRTRRRVPQAKARRRRAARAIHSSWPTTPSSWRRPRE